MIVLMVMNVHTRNLYLEMLYVSFEHDFVKHVNNTSCYVCVYGCVSSCIGKC